MQESHKPLNLRQLRLPIGNASKPTITNDKEQELAMALVELLLSAAQENNEPSANGGKDELETDR